MAYLILLDNHPSTTRFEVGKFLLNVKNLTPFLKRVRFFFIPKYKLFSPANGQLLVEIISLINSIIEVHKKRNK